MLLAQTASAQMVTVEGYGPDRGSALRDAERLAVENVVGTFIDSKTLVSQGRLLWMKFMPRLPALSGIALSSAKGQLLMGTRYRQRWMWIPMAIPLW